MEDGKQDGLPSENYHTVREFDGLHLRSGSPLARTARATNSGKSLLCVSAVSNGVGNRETRTVY